MYSSLGLHIPRFNSIITSQLRGILKRKHTLPYFKLRGPPLIKRPLQPTNEEGCSVPPGRLTGAVVKCSRLQVRTTFKSNSPFLFDYQKSLRVGIHSPDSNYFFLSPPSPSKENSADCRCHMSVAVLMYLFCFSLGILFLFVCLIALIPFSRD